MDTPKETILAVIRSMPDDATWDQIRYRMDVVTGVALGLEDVEAGRVIPHEQFSREMDEWLASFGAKWAAPAAVSPSVGSP